MPDQLGLFKTLFKGREDVFAIRWEKEGKTGYMPAYDLDWNEYAKHKARGGSLKDFHNKNYQLLSDDKLNQHLSGESIIGVYPLLQDNTSWFITADFDQGSSEKKNWAEECRLFISLCKEFKLPAYLERSRSGQGGHVWMFFERPYPAFKSRKIFHTILTRAGVISAINDKKSNFDRLFPNQDYHSGRGFGNLIALPLQKRALENRNSCFVDPVSLDPFADQWSFLQNVQKIPGVQLDEIFNSILLSDNQATIQSASKPSFDGTMHITLDNQISIPRSHLDAEMIGLLRDRLNFINVDFLIKRKAGKNAYQNDAFFRMLGEENDIVIIPRGFTGKLLRLCKEKNIPYQLKDERRKLEEIDFRSDISLHEYQKEAVGITNKKDFGVIVAPPGAGKTVMGLSIIASKKQPALIIVHRRQLFDQWIERIQSFLRIPKFAIGKIEKGKCEIGHEVTVAMIQSLQASDLPDNLHHGFGIILVDECHHIPAKTFRAVIEKFHSYYLYGFTATPKRKNGDEKLMFIHIGDIIHEVNFPANESGRSGQLSVIVRETDLLTPFDSKTDNTETLLPILIHDTARNELIANDIKREVAAGRKVLVLTERKTHTVILNQYLRSSAETIVLTGEDSAQARKLKQEQIRDGNFQILIATGQLIGEGTDIDALDCLVLAYPFSFEGKLIQYIGRVQRGTIKPVIYDYRDRKIEYFENLFKIRNRYYRKLVKNGRIKQFEELVLVFESRAFYIHSRENRFPIECLDLPIPIQEFLPDISWKVRVVKYNEDDGELMCEIMDYNSSGIGLTGSRIGSFYFHGIERIKFRAIDTAAFLGSVVLKGRSSLQKGSLLDVNERNKRPAENVIIRSMKVPFWKIRFLYGSVSFPIYIEEIRRELTFEIANADIRPEFEAIKEYFGKVLKKKLISADIVIRYAAEAVISFSVKSDDISNINAAVIEGVRFEFVRKKILKTNDESLLSKTNTVEDLMGQYQSVYGNMYSSEKDLINDILDIKKTKHFLQLKWLSGKHEGRVLKLRFILQPFSFLFLLSGENKYHVIWETLDTEEATYIWHSEKTRESLRKTLENIEAVIAEIKKNGRQRYLEKESESFSRVLHDYSDLKKGFVLWKALMEERMV